MATEGGLVVDEGAGAGEVEGTGAPVVDVVDTGSFFISVIISSDRGTLNIYCKSNVKFFFGTGT